MKQCVRNQVVLLAISFVLPLLTSVSAMGKVSARDTFHLVDTCTSNSHWTSVLQNEKYKVESQNYFCGFEGLVVYFVARALEGTQVRLSTYLEAC